MTTLPTWLVVVLGLAGPVVAGLSILANELIDRRRRRHERTSQHLEMEDRRLSTLREDRLRVYSALVRQTKVIRPAPPEEVQEETGGFAETLAEVELLSDDPQLLKAAAEVVARAGLARMAAWRLHENRGTQEEVEAVGNTLTESRMKFIQRAKEELGQRPSNALGSPNRSESVPEDAGGGAAPEEREKGSERPWWRVFGN